MTNEKEVCDCPKDEQQQEIITDTLFTDGHAHEIVLGYICNNCGGVIEVEMPEYDPDEEQGAVC